MPDGEPQTSRLVFDRLCLTLGLTAAAYFGASVAAAIRSGHPREAGLAALALGLLATSLAVILVPSDQGMASRGRPGSSHDLEANDHVNN